MAPSTRQEVRNGRGELTAITYDSLNEVTLRLMVVGQDDATKFLEAMQQLADGAELKALEIKPKFTRDGKDRKYVFG